MKCTKITGHSSYEDFALVAFRSKKMRKIISGCTVVCLLGIVIVYICFVMTLIPTIAIAIVGVDNESNLPRFLQMN